MSDWFVIRTAPGAQMPQREYAVEKTGRGKGYRIMPSLNPNVSAVERSLSQNGFTFYMPVEMKAIRDRRHTGVWTTRRFSLLPGYCFVHDPHDWRLLDETPGVVGIIGIDGIPLQVSIVDIMALRTIEAKKQAEAERDARHQMSYMAAQASRTSAKAAKKAKRYFVTGSRVDVLYGAAIGRQATITGWEAGTLRAIADGLEGIGTISLTTDMVRMVA